MCSGHCCSGSSCGACKAIRMIVGLFFTLTSVASLVAVYRTHFTPNGMVFGTIEASVALLTFIVSLTVWYKTVKKLCPCRSKGCGCGTADCHCDDKGMPSKMGK